MMSPLKLFGKIPEQIKRLSLIFILVIVVFLVVRRHFIPETFGKYGHYRGAALDDAKLIPIQYAERDKCEECHDDKVKILNSSYHKGLSCEVCHGPAEKHVEAEGDYELPLPTKREFCYKCHAYLDARPTGFPQIDPMSHNPNKPCIKCHNPHDPTPPHPPSECKVCHSAIASMKMVSPHTSLECTTCHTTPKEHKLNPKKYTPTKPSARDFCGRCHAKDARSSSEIPRVDMEKHGNTYVCWECHYPHSPQAE